MGVPYFALVFLLGLAVGLIASPRRAARLQTVAPKRGGGTWPANARERVRAGTILGPVVVPEALASQPATEVAEYERAAAGPVPPTFRFRPLLLLHFGGWRPFRDGIEKTFACDGRIDAALFVSRLAGVVRSIDELARLRSRIRGSTVQVLILATAIDGRVRRQLADADLAGRIDALGKETICPSLFR
jgi:hypothetical protein